MDYDIKKVEKYKYALKYFNQHFASGNGRKINDNVLPFSLRFFYKNCDPQNSFYYNSWLITFIDENIGEKIDRDIIKFRKEIEKNNLLQKFKLLNEDYYDNFIDREHNAYSISRGDISNGKISNELLISYGLKYENKETLLILLALSQMLNNNKIIESTNRFEDKKGNLLKGKLINEILENLRKFPDYKDIIETAYFKDLRHNTLHNNFKVDNENKIITLIDDKSIKISFDKFKKSLYVLQQLSNQIRFILFFNFQIKEIKRYSGILKLVTVFENKEELVLFQLKPFFKLDKLQAMQTNNITIKKQQSNIISIWNDMDLMINNIHLDNQLCEWLFLKNKKIKIISITPNLYKNNKGLKCVEFENEDFIIEDDYSFVNIMLDPLSNFNDKDIKLHELQLGEIVEL